MKSLYIFSLFIVFSLFLHACSATQYYYNSSAHIPHYTSNTETIMNVMLTESGNSRSYGVLTATDDQTVNYLLIAPKTSGQKSARNQLSNFNINEATYIDLDAAEDFRQSLSRIVSEWDKLREEDGYFYQFGSAPEINVNQLDEKTIEFIPSLRFYFNITNEGPTGEMILEYLNRRTLNSTIRRIEMNSKSDIEDLLALITIGLNYFN